jgi:hypothetical protein
MGILRGHLVPAPAGLHRPGVDTLRPKWIDADGSGSRYCPGSLVATADGGRTWQRIALNMAVGTDYLDFVTPSVGFGDGYGTSDGGRDWRLLQP